MEDYQNWTLFSHKYDNIFHSINQIKVSNYGIAIFSWRATWNYVKSPFEYIDVELTKQYRLQI